MKDRYRLFLRRKSVYQAFDNDNKTFQSLKTKDKAQANRLLMALNESGKQPAMNLGLARVYLKHSDPMINQRTWQHVFDEIIKLKHGENQCRWTCAVQDHAFDGIRNVLVMETRPEHLLRGFMGLPFKDRKLVPQGQDLQGELVLGAEPGQKVAQERRDNCEHGLLT
jgi:hypothetical protein